MGDHVSQTPLLATRAIPSIPITGTSIGSDPTTTLIPGATDVEAALAALQAEIAALGSGLPWFIPTAATEVALNAAIADWNTAGVGVLYIPSTLGPITCASGLTTITASGMVLGDGMGTWSSTSSTPLGTSSLINCSSATAVLFTVTGGVQFHGISLVNTSGSASAGAAIQVSGSDYRQHVTLDFVFIAGFYIGVDCRVNSAFVMNACSIWNPVLYGVKIQNTVIADAGGASITGCTIVSETQGATAGIRIESSGGNKIIGTNINNIGTYGIQLAASAASSILIVEGCSIENYTGDGIHLDGNGHVYRFMVITGNEFGQYSNGTGRAIYTTGIDQIVIDNNTMIADTGTPTAISLNSGSGAFVGRNQQTGFTTLLATSSFTSLADSTGAVAASVLITGTPSSGDVPIASSGTAAAWGAPSGGTLAGDVSGPAGSNTVDKITGIPITGAPDGTKFLHDDGVWSVVPGSVVGVGTYGLLVEDGATAPPVTLYTEDGTDWLYADG